MPPYAMSSKLVRLMEAAIAGDLGFAQILNPKHERRFTGFDDKIIAMYARGMTMREIQAFLAEQYGTEVSPEFIRSMIRRKASMNPFPLRLFRGNYDNLIPYFHLKRLPDLEARPFQPYPT
ncbi:hypothetical protein CNECB9_5080013 [Cupriavidus necator]|uniref:Uncharacterized protein n=1 Tax=Cupriavidus necator TaxID=106590 RepID=A0A1K0INC3_CUPNE|nr:hypothetical protein CNECB9_5080013 [Cupriavidus necator]